MVFQQLAGAALIAAGTGAREVAGGQQEDALREAAARGEQMQLGHVRERVGNRDAELAMLFEADQAQTQRLKELGLNLAREDARTTGMELFREQAAGAQEALAELAPPPQAPPGGTAGGGVQERAGDRYGALQDLMGQRQEQVAGQVATGQARREMARDARLEDARQPDVDAARVLFEQDRMQMQAEHARAQAEFENDLRQASKRGAILNAFGGLAQQIGGGLLGGGMGGK